MGIHATALTDDDTAGTLTILRALSDRLVDQLDRPDPDVNLEQARLTAFVLSDQLNLITTAGP